MSTWELVGAIIGTICFVIWVPCMISWIRHGVSIPRYVHLLAAVMTCVGVSCLIALFVAGMVTLKLAIAFLVVPPALTYFGWFWMFGPEMSS
jgi:hypothetical protein